MARSTRPPASTRRRSRRSLLSLTLAGWQLRQTWRLLLVIGVGVIAAVIIVCAVPLYSQISETAELQNSLNTDSAVNSYVSVQSQVQRISSSNIQDMQNALTQAFQQQLGAYLKPGVQMSVEIDDLSILSRKLLPGGHISYQPTRNLINLVGETMSQARAHLTLLKGRLPQDNPNALEIALPPATAKSLGLKPGSMIATQIAFTALNGQGFTFNLDLLVSGIFTANTDSFWHGQDFGCTIEGIDSVLCSALVANDGFLDALDRLQFSAAGGHTDIQTPPALTFYYQMDTARVTVSSISAIEQGLNSIAVNLSTFNDPPYIVQDSLTDPVSTVFDQFTNRNAVVQIPIVSLSLLVVGLTLFFVITMTDILVDRQSDAMAVLRSRGASRWQLFSALLAQNMGICLAALILGPLAAILVVPLFSLATLPRADTGAVTVLSSDLPGTIQVIVVPTLVTIVVALLAMAIALGGAVQRGILSLRREAARSTYRPLWQRVNADVIAAVIALAGFGFSVYEASPGVLDERVRVLVLPPLTLAGVVFLLIGLSLLILRAFPLILRGGSRLAQRNRGAVSMLAVAQMARAPRQSLRMTMLLAFSVAFAIFALVFNASQTQRILDVANYQVGADFSGQLSGAMSANSPQSITSTYSHIPGVLSAAIGYSTVPTVTEGEQSASVQLLAVDANSFAQATIWDEQDSARPIDALMRQLASQRKSAEKLSLLPAIIDSAAASVLHLFSGASFTVFDINGTLTCTVIAEVQRIPTVNDSALATGTNEFSAQGGVLVDYQTYAALSQKVNSAAITPNTIWLKTRDDAASLTRVRAALTSGSLALSNVNDRRAIIENLSNDPLYLDLTGLLVIGTVIAILLALVGNLIASWLSVRTRLTSFAVLRALGTAPKQLAGILGWEQGIIYAAALLLGVVFGILLSVLALPSLVFTNIAVSGFSGSISAGQYYVLQTIPPIRIIIPTSLWVVFALIAAICIAALIMMVRVAARPSVSQTLRLSED